MMNDKERLLYLQRLMPNPSMDSVLELYEAMGKNNQPTACQDGYQAWSRGPAKKQSIVLYGAREYGRMTRCKLEQAGYNVVAYCDDYLRGTIIDAIPVISFEEIEKIQDVFVYVTSNFDELLVQRLNNAGIRNGGRAPNPFFDVSGQAWSELIREWLEYFNAKKQAIRMVYDSFAEEKSKKIFLLLLANRLLSDFSLLANLAEGNQYFSIPGMIDENEVFVDCGALYGDSLHKFLLNCGGKFNSFYAFEPDAHFYQALKKYAEVIKDTGFAKNVILENAGLGCQASFEVFPEYQIGSEQRKFTNHKVPVYTLDEYFSSKSITFLKADIEGAEMDLLRGGEKIIRRDTPKIAVCVYHRPADIVEIPLFLKRLVPEYKFALRHHSSDWSETVLYAYTDQHGIRI